MCLRLLHEPCLTNVGRLKTLQSMSFQDVDVHSAPSLTCLCCAFQSYLLVCSMSHLCERVLTCLVNSTSAEGACACLKIVNQIHPQALGIESKSGGPPIEALALAEELPLPSVRPCWF